MKEIETIELITSMGNGFAHVVGQCGITSIKEETKIISTDTMISVFRIYKGDECTSEISCSTPYIITYKS